MVNRPPRKGDIVIYKPTGVFVSNSLKPIDYIVLGRHKNYTDILNIAKVSDVDKNGNVLHHTQIIWTFKEGPNPFLTYKKQKMKVNDMGEQIK